jgi:hypothetical protein
MPFTTLPPKTLTLRVAALLVTTALVTSGRQARAEPTTRTRNAMALTLGASAVVFAGAGAASLVLSSSAADEKAGIAQTRTRTPCLYYASSTCSAYANAAGREETYGALAVPLFAAAATFGIGAALTMLLWPKAETRTSTVTPLAGPSALGAAYTTRF